MTEKRSYQIIRTVSSLQLKGQLASFAIFLVRWIVRILPLSLSLPLLRGFGLIASYMFPREVAISIAQMRYVQRFRGPLSQTLDEALRQPESLSRRVFQHVGECIAEIFVIDRLLKDNQNHVRGTGMEHVFKIINNGSSALALSGHVGCIELLAAYHIREGVPLAVVARHPNYSSMSVWLENIRRGYGVEMIWRDDERGARTIVKALKGRRVVAALIDQDTTIENAFSPFFGLEAAYPVALINLAIRLEVPILTSFIVRRAPGQHEVISEPIQYDPADPSAMHKVLHVFNHRLEQLIAENPEQWIWWHRRWRRRPGIDYELSREALPSTEEYLTWLEDQGLGKIDMRKQG